MDQSNRGGLTFIESSRTFIIILSLSLSLLVITRDHRCRCSLRPFISFVHRVKAPRFRGMKYASVTLIIMRLDNAPFLSLSLSFLSRYKGQLTIDRLFDRVEGEFENEHLFCWNNGNELADINTNFDKFNFLEEGIYVKWGFNNSLLSQENRWRVINRNYCRNSWGFIVGKLLLLSPSCTGIHWNYPSVNIVKAICAPCCPSPPPPFRIFFNSRSF